MSLLVVGSVAYDSVATPLGSRDDLLGGSATYFSLAASFFSRPSIVAVIGSDFRDTDRAILEAHHVDISGLEQVAGETFRWSGRYHADMNGRDTLYTKLNVFETFDPKLDEVHRGAPFVFLGNIQPSLQHRVLEQVATPRFVAADTMNLWIDGSRDELIEVLRRVDALFINDEEAKQLTGERTMVRAAEAIQALGPELVVIKRGEHGAIMFNDEDVFYVPAYPLERVVDPTGAGDSFAGGFVGYLASTGDFGPANVRRAAVVGSLMASFCVEGYSVEQLRVLDMHAIRERFKAFVALTRFEGLAL